MPDDIKRIIQNVNNSFWFERVHNNGAAEYVSGDVVGTVRNINVRGYGGGGTIRVINVIANGTVALPLRIWFFRREPSAQVDNAPMVLHINDTKKLAGYRDIAAGLYVTNGNLRIAHLPAANVDFSCPTNGRLYYIVEARGTGTYPAINRLEINMGDWPD